MQYAEKEFILNNGEKCILRSPFPEDAQIMIDYLVQTSGETHFMVRYPEEVQSSLEWEEYIIQQNIDNKQSLMLMAFINGEMAGNAGIACVEDRIKMRHRCSVGICLKEKFWGRGIGTLLMQEQIINARKMGYEQMELGVFADNANARAMYKKLGFEEWGTMKNAFRLKDGTYRDEIQMGLFLKEEWA